MPNKMEDEARSWMSNLRISLQKEGEKRDRQTRKTWRERSRCFECLKFLSDPNEVELKKDEIDSLKKCTGCKIVEYCSKDCQKKNWSKHRACCNYIQKLNFDIKTVAENK